MPEIINEFKGRYRFLSNFFLHDPIRFDGMEADCVEKLYQAAKAVSPYSREIILSANTPALAKKRGKELILRGDWLYVRVGIMEELLRLKFKLPDLKKLLLLTYPAYLEEGNNHGDMFWGVYKGQGQNKLGHLLMKIRDELMEE